MNSSSENQLEGFPVNPSSFDFSTNSLFLSQILLFYNITGLCIVVYWFGNVILTLVVVIVIVVVILVVVVLVVVVFIIVVIHFLYIIFLKSKALRYHFLNYFLS
jgi:hypothetical protein